ncbi:MAG: adenylate/guanylate cyclase domain-containing protein [Desulfosalsimonadaceae bacterium]|nr:adenylate/guanylate cyclase domain-containing protein [Desulfosalsimonadaceae bacterium]
MMKARKKDRTADAQHRDGLWHLRHLGMGAAVFCLLLLISFAPPFRVVDNRVTDWFSTLFPPELTGSPVVLVGIDEPSFREIGLQWPWPRDLHARLVHKLKAAGASVIALDLVFAEPSTLQADAALADAIFQAGAVVLAAEETLEETAYVSQLITIPPMDPFVSAGGAPGVAAVSLDPDGLIRRIPLRKDGFALMALNKWQEINHVPISRPPEPENRYFLQFFGPSRTYPYVSYYQAMDPDRFLPPGTFHNKIAIVGRSVKTAPDLGTRQADMFSTPFTWDSGVLTAGIEIHATIIDNLRLNRFFRQPPPVVYFSLLAAFVFFSGLWFREWRPLRSGATALGLCGTAVVTSFAALKWGRFWVSPALFVAGALAQYGTAGGIAFLKERAGRKFIKEAFSRYLSPALVDQLAADPSRLILGGEIRLMTIMFCDVRGFTTLSERFSNAPQELTKLMNRFFTAMTAVILRHSGTVDKYIGDCIMAFWNAPVDDPDHACHACGAALDMAAELRNLNRQWAGAAASEGGEPLCLGIGIGINTGSCVAGNLGSEQRFDYSVLGDPVNISSRLEGQSKTYGVEIVIGPETASAAADFALLELDLIAVKGKKEAVRVYTVLGGPDRRSTPAFQELAACHQEMINHYRRMEWAGARGKLGQCRSAAPELGLLYDLYEHRISEYEISPPNAGWSGVYVAKSK